MSVTLGNIYMKTVSLGSHDVYEMSLGNNIVRPIPNTITGNNYVSLSNALRLEYLKIYGNTIQGLPSGFTQLEYIESTGTQYIDTGFTWENSTKIDFTIEKLGDNAGQTERTSRANVWFGANGSSGTENMLGWGAGGSTNYFRGFSSGTSTYKLPLNTKTNITFDYTKGAVKLFANGVQQGNTGTSTNTSTSNILLCGVKDIASGAPILFCLERFYNNVKIWNGETLVANLIPSKRNSNNVIGMYDLISNTFFTNAGTGAFTAGPTVPTPENPIEVKGVGDSLLPDGYTQLEYIEGTSSLTLNNKTTNNTEIEVKWYRRTSTAEYLYNSDSGSALTTNTTAYISTSGNWRFGNKTVVILFNVGETYTTIQNKNGIWIDGEKKYAYSNVGTFTSTDNLKVFSDVPEHPLRLYYLKQSESGTLVGHYIPCKHGNDVGLYDLVGKEFYTNSGIIAGPEIYQIPVKVNNILQQTIYLNSPLHKVGDYQDVLNSNGTITRNVGVKVLDGTESWTENSSDYYCDVSGKVNGTVPVKCTHFNNLKFYMYRNVGFYKTDMPTTVTDLATWKQRLAQQYANGTPVIIYYPLATPTTETITMQPILISEGNNTIELQLNDIDNAQLEVKYSSWK